MSETGGSSTVISTKKDLEPLALAKESVELTAEEREKKAKNIRKKLKQIEELKEKQQIGESLNSDQIGKLDAEADLKRELELLSI